MRGADTLPGFPWGGGLDLCSSTVGGGESTRSEEDPRNCHAVYAGKFVFSQWAQSTYLAPSTRLLQVLSAGPACLPHQPSPLQVLALTPYHTAGIGKKNTTPNSELLTLKQTSR